VDGSLLLNCLGYAMEEYKKGHAVDSFDVRALFPSLDSLEDTLLDWRIADSLDRSAYQVMSAMDRRESEREEDRYLAMVGAIAENPITDRDELDPVEHFMQLCERKGDFSFIFSTARRSERPGKGWRPSSGPLQVVMPWSSYGARQSGHIHGSQLQLDNVYVLSPGSIEQSAMIFIANWLGAANEQFPRDHVLKLILSKLRNAGYSGCGECLETAAGFLYPQLPVRPEQNPLIIVSTEVRMSHGAPGCVLAAACPDGWRFLTAGMFVGHVPTKGVR